MPEIFTDYTSENLDDSPNCSEHKIYSPQSDKLNYIGTEIIYSEYSDMPIKLNKLYIPVSAQSPKLKRMSDNATYTNTALALCDLVIRKNKNNAPSRTALSKSIYKYWNTILFLRDRGIFYLKDCKKEDLHALCKIYAKGGWREALKIEEKVTKIISTMNRDEIEDAVIFYHPASRSIDALKAKFWEERLGFNNIEVLNLKTKVIFENKAAEFGFKFADRWAKRFQINSSIPTDGSLKNFLSFLNNLYYVSNSVDKFTFHPFENITFAGRKYAYRSGDRTPNLHVDLATHILGKSLDWIYSHGPKLVSILESTRHQMIQGSQVTKRFLRTSDPFRELAEDLNIKSPDVWCASNYNGANGNDCQPVSRLIAALHGACAVAIAGFNARRSAEVCDSKIGIRVNDLCVDNDSDLHMVSFYIEKSFQERHLFYINKVTFDAINLLIRLKTACLPINKEPTSDFYNESIFMFHRWTDIGPTTLGMFNFSKSINNINSISSFISFLDEEHHDIDLRSHMWRRFFALIYIYQYDHSNLQSLSEHLGHAGITQTIVYVTDTQARAQKECIASKIPQLKNQKVLDVMLLNSLYNESQELEEIIQIVRNEKLGLTIQSIIRADSVSGGFPRLVRKLYKLLSKEAVFAQLTETEKGENLTSALISRGYTCEPMPHGQCNAPSNDFTFAGKCSDNGRLKKERASATFCQGCMFHCKTEGFIQNLRKEILVLEEDITSDLTPAVIQRQAREAKQALLDIIDIHNIAVKQNSAAMRALVNSYERN